MFCFINKHRDFSRDENSEWLGELISNICYAQIFEDYIAFLKGCPDVHIDYSDYLGFLQDALNSHFVDEEKRKGDN